MADCDDPGRPPPEFYEAMAKHCRCCSCVNPPCDGVCAGGICDNVCFCGERRESDGLNPPDGDYWDEPDHG